MAPNEAKTARETHRRGSVVFAFLAATSAMASCTTEDVDWHDDGGAAVRPDAAAEGGSTMDSGAPPPMCPMGPLPTWCATPVSVSTAVIADFTGPPGGTPPVFGTYGMSVWGGVYAYPPSTPDPCTDAGLLPYPISSEMRNNEWRVTGVLGSYSGFGLWWNCTVGGNLYPVCVIDVSNFSGIRFSIHGDAGPTGRLVLQMRTAENALAPTDPNTSSCGQCTGMCAFASKTIPVTSGRTTITVSWPELTGGDPHAFDPRHVTGIEWQFQYSGMGTFPIDVAVDDIELVK